MKKILSIVLTIVIILSIFTIIPVDINAAAGIANNGIGGIYIDINAAPYTDSRWYEYGDPYGSGGCTWFVGARVMQLTGKGTYYTQNCSSWYYSYGPSLGFSTGSTPQAPAVICYSGHIAFLEKIEGNTAYISEGGVNQYKHDGSWQNWASGNSYTAIHRIEVGEISSWCGYRSDFLGYVYLGDTDPGGANPEGNLDHVSGQVGSVRVAGWVFDRDDISQSLWLHVYIGPGPGQSGAEAYGVYANLSRKDVDNVHHVGEYHGFDVSVPTSRTGSQIVRVYAINIGSGDNKLIGEATVNISADTESPVVKERYLSNITNESYRFNIKVTDNVAIKRVSLATWTQQDQSDLIWHDAQKDDSGVYYVDIKRSDYSNSSLYINHCYCYDYAGNEAFSGINTDYKSKSETGKNIPEGDYRIVTAVNENRALDVDENSLNGQIWQNLDNENQVFNIKYTDNGFYNVIHNHTGKAIDVEGNTYLSGANIIAYLQNGGANQEWMILPTDENDGYYYFVCRSNNLALDITSAEDKNGTNVQAFTRNQSTAQKWKLRRVLKDDMITIEDVTIHSETSAVNPQINVIVDGAELTQNSDYTVSCSVDIAAGKGTVTITGVNDYCDSITKNFKINVTPGILGDIDGDEEVGVIDATYIQRYEAGFNIPIPEDDILARGDVDGDEEVTVLDATYIQRYDAGFDTPYPIGEVI